MRHARDETDPYVRTYGRRIQNGGVSSFTQDEPLPNDSRWTPWLGQAGGGPGLDGCNYTSGAGCPCHHLNGGPCLFDVVNDKTEAHNLANSSARESSESPAACHVSQRACV